MNNKMRQIVSSKHISKTKPHIESSIILVRGERVIFDSDLASIYGVTTKRLNEQVKRNIEKFPPDFAFQLSKIEFANLKSQNATSKFKITICGLETIVFEFFSKDKQCT
jgi:hypothetical protein